MGTPKNRIRITLVGLTIAIVVLNGGMFYIATGFPSRSVDPSRLEEVITKIERGEIDVTKERHLASVSRMKRMAEAADRMFEALQRFIFLLAIGNVVIVLAVVGMLWGVTGKRGPSTDA